MVMMAVVCAPEQEHVTCLDPECVTPQDGQEKQDCEQQAIKRWLADDFHCHQPLCEKLLQHNWQRLLDFMYQRLDLAPDLG